MNRRLTPDQRVGLNVVGLLLLMIAIAVGAYAYHAFGLPKWPLPTDELIWAFGAAVLGLVGLGCLYRGTDVVS